MTKGFPLGINKNMDDHARRCGMGHWSCTTPESNQYWVRFDGLVCSIDFGNFDSYADCLRQCDRDNPCESVFPDLDIPKNVRLLIVDKLFPDQSYYMDDIPNNLDDFLFGKDVSTYEFIAVIEDRDNFIIQITSKDRRKVLTQIIDPLIWGNKNFYER